MGDILKAIDEDSDDYYALCRKYGEKENGGPYGEHAQQLHARERGKEAEFLAGRAVARERERKKNELASSIQQISEDITFYERLCEKYKEQVRTMKLGNGRTAPNPYCRHARMLREREAKRRVRRPRRA